jgi:predicted DCC family thiol-disulfide oxidoreductase YuxK
VHIDQDPSNDPTSRACDRLARPLVLFDGDCGVCARVAERLAARHGRAVAEWRPWQGEPALPAGLTPDRLEREIVMVRADGSTLGGHRVFRAILARTPGWRGLGLAMWIPPVGLVAQLAYRAIAARRRWISLRLGLNACGVRAFGRTSLPAPGAQLDEAVLDLRAPRPTALER